MNQAAHVQVNGEVPFSAEELEVNIRSCLKRGLPEFGPYMGSPHKGKFCIVGSGPSLKRTLPKLRKMQAKGAKVYAVNSAADVLISKGLIPDVHYLLDASDQVLRFIEKPHRGVEYMVASHCDPKVFDRLEGYDVTVYHAHMARNEIAVLQERDKLRDEQGLSPYPSMVLPGGSTAAMRLYFVGMNLGYTEYHLFGVDSSYGKKKTHADRDEKELLTGVKAGAILDHTTDIYDASLQMYIQAQDFEAFIDNFGRYVIMFCHGKGLIQSLWRKHYDTRTGRPKCIPNIQQRRAGPDPDPHPGRRRSRFRDAQAAS